MHFRFYTGACKTNYDIRNHRNQRPKRPTKTTINETTARTRRPKKPRAGGDWPRGWAGKRNTKRWNQHRPLGGGAKPPNPSTNPVRRRAREPPRFGRIARGRNRPDPWGAKPSLSHQARGDIAEFRSTGREFPCAPPVRRIAGQMVGPRAAETPFVFYAESHTAARRSTGRYPALSAHVSGDFAQYRKIGSASRYIRLFATDPAGRLIAGPVEFSWVF